MRPPRSPSCQVQGTVCECECFSQSPAPGPCAGEQFKSSEGGLVGQRPLPGAGRLPRYLAGQCPHRSGPLK